MVEALATITMLAFAFLGFGALAASTLLAKRPPHRLVSMTKIYESPADTLNRLGLDKTISTQDRSANVGSQDNDRADQRDSDLARKAAELALSDAEAFVRQPSIRYAAFSGTCAEGMCLPSRTETPVWSDPQLHVWEGTATSRPTERTLPNVSRAPRYIIEALDSASAAEAHEGAAAYRITVSGWGATPTTQVGLQTTIYVQN
jgi:Tfp pilus assembly protein PilX